MTSHNEMIFETKYIIIFSEDFINTNNSRDSIWPKEWKLVYSPKNDVLELLLNETAKLMQFEGVMGVENASEVEQVMIKSDYFAGVIFDHEEVHNCFEIRFKISHY